MTSNGEAECFGLWFRADAPRGFHLASIWLTAITLQRQLAGKTWLVIGESWIRLVPSQLHTYKSRGLPAGPGPACSQRGQAIFRTRPLKWDVMDTWLTSRVTQILEADWSLLLHCSYAADRAIRAHDWRHAPWLTTTCLEALNCCQIKTKIMFWALRKFQKNVSFQKRISRKRWIYTYVFYELTISNFYFIVLVWKNGLWRLTLVQSSLGTACELWRHG